MPTAAIVTLNPYPTVGSQNIYITLNISEQLIQTPTLSFITSTGSTYSITLLVTQNTVYYGEIQIQGSRGDGVATFTITMEDLVGNTSNTLDGTILTLAAPWIST